MPGIWSVPFFHGAPSWTAAQSICENGFGAKDWLGRRVLEAPSRVYAPERPVLVPSGLSVCGALQLILAQFVPAPVPALPICHHFHGGQWRRRTSVAYEEVKDDAGKWLWMMGEGVVRRREIIIKLCNYIQDQLCHFSFCIDKQILTQILCSFHTTSEGPSLSWERERERERERDRAW